MRRLEYFQKNQALFNRERLARQLRDARSQAEALESYLSSMNPAYRQAMDASARRERLERLARTMPGVPIAAAIPLAFRGRMAPEEMLKFYPTSYDHLRMAL